jgi:hypothetical protein
MTTTQRAAGVGLAFVLAAAVAGAQGTSGVALTRQHGNNLYVEINGQKLSTFLSIGIPAELVISVSPQDSLGNSIPLTGFEAQVWDSNVVAIAGTTVMATRAEIRVTPKHPGQTTIQVRASGLRSWVVMELGKEQIRFTPGGPAGERGPSNNILVAGGRLSYAGYNYSYVPGKPTFTGTGGVVAEAYIGRTYDFGLTLVLSAGLGVLKADSVGTSVTAKEFEFYLRGDYAFMPVSRIRPVVSLGTGLYRMGTGSKSVLWNSALFWTASGGVDYTLSPKAVGEFRLSTQQLYETFSQLRYNGQSANGYVGNLIVIGAGVRFQL